MIFISNFFIYFIILTISLISIIGYGILTSKILKFYPILDIKITHYFLMGLIFIGSISICFNIFLPISDSYTLILISLGILLFFYLYKNVYADIKKIILLLPIILLALVISFYAGLSDDFDYHWSTILNFKSQYLLQIEHERRISYNSHWLFINSIFYISFIKFSLFSLPALLYSVIQIDLLKILKNFYKHSHAVSIFALFSVIFLFGVVNIYKDFGTDIPGVIVSIFILLNLLFLLSNESNENKNYIIYLILLINLVFMIKVTNSLIFLYILFFIFIIKFKIYTLLSAKIFIVFLPLSLWVFQNLAISGCFIWPISALCIFNKELTYEELYLIEAFAKGDRQVLMNVEGFSWISKWFENHFHKLIETYFLYIVFLIIPLIIFRFKVANVFFVKQTIKNLKISKFRNIFIFIIPSVLINIIWFLFYPAYRFGIFYNLTLIFFILYPFWYLLRNNELFFKKTFIIIFSVAILFFFYANISRLNWYYEKYGALWPPILNNQIIIKYK